jgi:hypothetical protein
LAFKSLSPTFIGVAIVVRPLEFLYASAAFAFKLKFLLGTTIDTTKLLTKDFYQSEGESGALKFPELGGEYCAFLRPHIKVGIKLNEVNMIKILGRLGRLTPHRSRPKKSALIADSATVAINKESQTDFPRNAKTEVRHARTN